MNASASPFAPSRNPLPSSSTLPSIPQIISSSNPSNLATSSSLSTAAPSFFETNHASSGSASTPSALHASRPETPSFFDATSHATPKPKGSALRTATPGVFQSGGTQPIPAGTPMAHHPPMPLDLEPRSGLRGNELHPGGVGGTSMGLRKRVLTGGITAGSGANGNGIGNAAAGQGSPGHGGMLSGPFVNDENRQLQASGRLLGHAATGKGAGVVPGGSGEGIPGNSILDMSATPKLVDQVGGKSGTHASTSASVGGLGLDLGVARGLGVSSPAMHGMPQLHQHKNQWVTVFGYPMGAGAEVLRHFQACGEVHQHRSEPGNWMHLLYASPVQASRALAQNGQYIKIGGSVVMVGVKQCSEFDLGHVKTAPAAVSSRNLHHKQLANKHRVDRPQQLRHAPNKAASMCKRFWKWVLDW